jgi:hypothetical protein
VFGDVQVVEGDNEDDTNGKCVCVKIKQYTKTHHP